MTELRPEQPRQASGPQSAEHQPALAPEPTAVDPLGSAAENLSAPSEDPSEHAPAAGPALEVEGHLVHVAAGSKRRRRIPWKVRAALAAALVVGAAAGALVAVAVQPDPTTTAAYAALKETNSTQQASINGLQSSNQGLHSDIQGLQSKAEQLQSQVDADASASASQSASIAAKESDLQQRENAVKQREDAVQKREDAVKAAETVVASERVANGVHVVGQDVKPGVYRTTGPDGNNPVGCYYAWKSGTNADANIVENNITQGAATATLEDGQVFESSSCSAWTKIG